MHYDLGHKKFSEKDGIIDSLEGVSIVHAPRLPQVVDEVLAGVSPLIRLQDCLASDSGGDLLHLLLLECFPQVMRDVEHHALNEGLKFI